jgi:SAM-dependent methyltransferase
MDFRGKLTDEQVLNGIKVLDYQPFFLTDDVQTGAAPTWVYGINSKIGSPLVFHKEEYYDEWDKITDSNARLRVMYDAFMREIASRYKGGTLIDIACNNGYFPVAAELFGMKATTGADLGLHYANSIEFLNSILGTSTKFIHTFYDFRAHAAPIHEKYDVVCASAVMCHLPDPLNFLAYLGSIANEAVFYFGKVVETDALIAAFFKPHPDLGSREMPFPFRFNEMSRLSRGLLYHGFEEMGFRHILELPWKDEWLSPYLDQNVREPHLHGETREEVRRAWRLYEELRTGGEKHMAILAMR